METARRFGLDVHANIAAHIDRGELLSLAADSFGPCARVVTEERPAFERGWDVDASEAAENVVTELAPGSPAYAAGMRNGMKLFARAAGAPNDSRVDYVMRVADGSVERVIRFRPAGMSRTTIKELVLDRATLAAKSESCKRSLAG